MHLKKKFKNYRNKKAAQIEKLQQAFLILSETDPIEYKYFQNLGDCSFQEANKKILEEIIKNKDTYLADKQSQEEISKYQAQLTQAQKSLTGKAKFEEAYRILKEEWKQEEEAKLQKEINKSLLQFQKDTKKPLYLFNYKWTKKIGFALIGLVLLTAPVCYTAWLFSNNGFLLKETEEYTSLQLPKEIIKDKSYIETYYTPSYIPKGYILEETICRSNKYSTVYSIENSDNSIIYIQNRLKDLSNINNIEDYTIETINGKQIYYYKQGNAQMVIYSDGTYQFSIIMQDPNNTKETLIQILESLVPIEPENPS